MYLSAVFDWTILRSDFFFFFFVLTVIMTVMSGF